MSLLRDFHQRAQTHDETIAQYISALRDMLALCEFGNAEQDMLQDQIVEKAYSGRIRERLLLEHKLTLDKAIQIANQMELAQCQRTQTVKWRCGR